MWEFIFIASLILYCVLYLVKFTVMRKATLDEGSMLRLVDADNKPTDEYYCSNRHLFSTEGRSNLYWYMDDTRQELRAICPDCNEIDIPPG